MPWEVEQSWHHTWLFCFVFKSHLLACKVLGNTLFSLRGEKRNFIFTAVKILIPDQGGEREQTLHDLHMFHWAVPRLHIRSQHKVQNDSLKDNSSPPAASFDRAASSGNSTFTNLGFSAPSVQLSQPSHSSPNSSVYNFGKWGDMEKAERKRQKALQKSKESHTDKWKGAEHIFQKAEIPTSIRTCCLSNKSSWQIQLTSLEKMSVLIKDRGKENKRWNRRDTSKEQELCKNRRQGQRPFVFPTYGKVMPHDKEMTTGRAPGDICSLQTSRRTPPGETPTFP